ncbi:hypothetical protein A9D60_19730 [Leisingera sp. JC1]|nr:hypothetical protein A9D60_19730 [Leisingera sp. JC1]
MQFRRMLLGKGHVGQHALLGIVHQPGEPRQLAPHLVGDVAPLGFRRRMVRLCEGSGDKGGDDASTALARIRKSVPLEMHPTTLPGRVQHACD